MEKRKIFIYDSDANLVEEGPLSRMEELQQKTVVHNKVATAREWSLVVSERYPPAGYKWQASLRKYVPKTLPEKVRSGEVEIPPHMKVVGNRLEPMSLRELVDEGIVPLSSMEKISDDGESVEFLTPWEAYEKGVLSLSSLGERMKALSLNSLAIRKERLSNRFPLVTGMTSAYKELLVEEWLALKESEQQEILADSRRERFRFLLTEAGVTAETPAQDAHLLTGSANRFLYERKLWTREMEQLDAKESRRQEQIDQAVAERNPGSLKDAYEKIMEEKRRLVRYIKPLDSRPV